MIITVGSTNFEATHCERERDLKIGFYLLIKVPRTSIGGDELHDLLDGNTEVITVTKDDGTVENYEGFNSVELFDTKATEYIIKQACVSEAMAQISLLKARAAALEKENAEYKATIAALNQDLLAVQLATVDLYEKNLASEAVTSEGEV